MPLSKYTLIPATVIVLETFLENILCKPFQLVRRITKAPSFQHWFQLREKVRIVPKQVRRVWEEAPVLSRCSLLRNPRPNRPVCWRIVVKERPTVGYLFFGAFPSDRFLEGTKDVTVNLFIHSSNFCELYYWISVNYACEFEEFYGANTYMSPNESQFHYNKMPHSKRSQFNCIENVSCRI